MQLFPRARPEDDSTALLMTCHGTVLCRDGESGLRQVPLDALDDDGVLRLRRPELRRSARHARMLCKTNVPVILSDIPELPAGSQMTVNGDCRTVTISRGGRFFCAEPERADLPCDRDEPKAWEEFLIVSAADLAGIRFLLANSWIRATTQRVSRAAANRPVRDFRLGLGDLEIDLRYNTPFLTHPSGMAIDLLLDGWNIERLHLYRPFIYFTVFASPAVLQQAFTAIGSLLEFGHYDGHIHVITDQERQIFLDNIPGLAPEALTVQRLEARDWVGFVAAKYEILEFPPARAFQPLLFLDPDVVCDAPIEPLLATIATLGRMSAPLEDMTSLQNNPSVGASLIQRGGHSPRFACGFNGGTVGIPNLVEHGHTLALTQTIITNHADRFGRDQFRWVDQEVLNYVSYRVGHFDTAALLRHIRYGWEDDEFDATRRLGLVHFWPGIEGRPKEERMRAYVSTLRGAPK